LTRLGWILLAIFVGAVGLFALMLGPGEAETSEPAPRSSGEASWRAPSLIVPVAGVRSSQLTNTWGDERGGGTRQHNAIDIMAPRGTPVVAAAGGGVEKLFDSENGGLTVYVRSADKRIVYYYAHLDGYYPGLREGMVVRPGEVIGTVGSTGSASEDGPHLHFEIKRMAPGENWHEGQEVNPYPLLAGKPVAR
jgi:murein DD-endopeptidase MepM/ murein hydrolase activator NlpD